MTTNSTMMAYNTLASFDSAQGIAFLTLIIMLMIGLTLFLLLRNIRRAFYGGIVSGSTLGIYYLSRKMVVSAIGGNPTMLEFTLKAILFVMVSLIVGFFVEKLPPIRRLEDILRENKEHENTKS